MEMISSESRLRPSQNLVGQSDGGSHLGLIPCNAPTRTPDTMGQLAGSEAMRQNADAADLAASNKVGRRGADSSWGL